ncbi:MAG: SAM-dependent methyltransferase [Selenomonadaceae bacterium]|nr:SAM-dependent methyltransferase [Selenomonadaceae bacterium]MBR7024850.1 SAM-dependent methyltransferase [Selenomonadaceae bacterium]
MDSRMQAVLNFVAAGSRVADIGADHGYLSIELIKSGRAVKVIATEKNIGPFEALKKNISAAGFENFIEVRLGDGLKIFSAGEVDTICIAGMGGALIAKILDDAPEVVSSARQMILQPMNAAKKIREHLAKNDWVIVDEDLAEAGGIIYEIICAEKNSLPKKIFKRESSPLLKKFLTQRREKLQRVLAEMSKSESARASEKFSTTLKEIDALQKKLKL